ncbi:hypothetical protein Pint_32258 [Pistacia integerrima]|uniref:Uncharacterized protein n=1 Tax=Pistacia integerrima TaxID=434235 RepID=A0ACC0XPQ0_9ROSI|nr:hypothetical protein Pint_32258 [Pistacia integerrima]
MSTAPPPTPQKTKREKSFPPKRGKIKAKIFASLYKTVVSAASRAFAGNRGDGTDSATPPLSSSAYNSDANSELP